jgi:DNA-binding CsgD family transcriptional regulator
LEAAKKEFYALFEAVPDPLAITQADGIVLDMNVKLCRLLKTRKQKWIGKTVIDLIQAINIDLGYTEFGEASGKDGRMLVVVGGNKTSIRKENNSKQEEPAVIRQMVKHPFDNPAIERFGLNPEDLELLKLISTGLPTRKIALRMRRATATISAHRKHLHTKLCVTSDVSLVQLGNDLKLLGPDAYHYLHSPLKPKN